jgi:A/G-specific adenine glycosylase
MPVAAKALPRQRRQEGPAISFPQPTALLAWYDRHRRALPWRALPGQPSDPFHVWLSEIMLQQTTVKAVAPYYSRFLARWPDVQALAGAPIEDVLKAWAGLGYYARAHNLHACARAVVERHGGKFPATEAELRALPGIGAYTAAAIAAIAFDLPASPVDGNIERVIARLFAVAAPLPAAKPRLRRLAAELTPLGRAGDFAQAMMDLGATICTPKNPACALCPWNACCVARKRGDAETFPRRIRKRQGELRRGAAFVARRAGDHVLVRTRPAKGLLGGMTEVPTTEWAEDFNEKDAMRAAPLFSSPLPSGERSISRNRIAGNRVRRNRRRNSSRSVPPHPDPLPDGETEICWRRIPGTVQHTFTHFPLELYVYAAELPPGTPAPASMRWVALADIAGEALPSLMRKVIAHAL